MKRKKIIRISKRIFILFLCTTLLSGSVFHKNKINANATSLVLTTLGGYTLYEICLYIGTLLLAGLGVGIAYDNRDEIASLGKDFIDSCNLDELSGWVITKADIYGNSYVYGTEALEEVKETSWEVIEGGGNTPKNDEDGDGDKDSDDRTEELKKVGMWGTSVLTNWMCEQIQPLLDNAQSNFLNNYFSDALNYEGLLYNGDYPVNSEGLYEARAAFIAESPEYKYYLKSINGFKVCGYYRLESGASCYSFSFIKLSSSNTAVKYAPYYESWKLKDGVWSLSSSASGSNSSFFCSSYSANIPVFGSLEACENYLKTGDDSACLNMMKSFQIADWLKENWESSINAVNTGIRSLYDNMLIVGQAANQALQNQLNGLGYIETLLDLIRNTLLLPLPDTISDPIYVPGDSPEPGLDPGKLPWNSPNPVPDPDPTDPTPDDPDTGDPEDSEPRDTFGLNTIFGILILLILIILMLLAIFISCLAFIVMIFRIQATTGFLPEEMIAALDYLKTLQIPGFGMSVYNFFMSLIYIILIFTVIGILRKNIDKIKIPRKG